MGPDPLMRRGNFQEEKGQPIVKYRDFLSLAVQKTSEPIIWDVDSGGSKEACIRWGAHCRHLANTTEPSMCGIRLMLHQVILLHDFTAQLYRMTKSLYATVHVATATGCI